MLREVLFHLILTGFGVLASIVAFFVLCVAYGNHEIGFWSILSGVVAAVCFHLHWAKGRGTLDRWHTRITLRNLHVAGFFSAVAGVTALIWYIFLTCYYSIPVQPISESTAITGIWAMVCAYWGIDLMTQTHRLEIIIEEGSARILTESNA